MSETPKTLRELIVMGEAYLRGRAVADPRTVCELLAARLFNCGRLGLHPHLDVVPQTRIVDALRRGLLRVAGGEPVQYVLGRWDFRDLTLKVDRRALIPRPETEQLVDLVLASRQIKETPKPLVVDVGINRVKGEDGKTKMVGDVDPGAAEVAGILTPVPGGVGAVTAALLMKNTVAAAELQA